MINVRCKIITHGTFVFTTETAAPADIEYHFFYTFFLSYKIKIHGITDLVFFSWSNDILHAFNSGPTKTTFNRRRVGVMCKKNNSHLCKISTSKSTSAPENLIMEIFKTIYFTKHKLYE